MKDLGAVEDVNIGKFQEPERTKDGSARAHVALTNPQTLWFNTGTLCNITCANCYIESSPTNDRLSYISLPEVTSFLDQIAARKWPVREIGFTGGEPFMNPEILDILNESLQRGFDVLVLTNAMRPMQRKSVQEGLLALHQRYGAKLTLRISLDHHSEAIHDSERGAQSFARTLDGMLWLRDTGIRMAVAGRAQWHESDQAARVGYDALFAKHGFDIDAFNPLDCMLFPEMDMTAEVPEITTKCWETLRKSPQSVMCSSSRMVVKRKGAKRPSVLACTLLPYDPRFEMGHSLEEAEADVPLNHPHCAKFCVLGGASCSG